MEEKKTLLTVNVITYNHEKYVAQCLDSILEQKTDFNFVIRVFDDASTDRTQEICRQYKEKYPDKIQLFLAEQNLGKTDDGTLINALRSYENIETPYYIFIEGDDYCYGKKRFQKQLDILENNPDCVCCGGQIKSYVEEVSEFLGEPYEYKKNKYTIDDAKDTANYFHLQHSSKMIRTSAIRIDNEHPLYWCFDITQIYELIQVGNIYILNTPVSVYRIVNGGESVYCSIGFEKIHDFLYKTIVDYNEYTNKIFSKNLFHIFIAELTCKYYHKFNMEECLSVNFFKCRMKRLKHYFVPPFIRDILNIPRDISRLVKRHFLKR